MVRWFKSTGIPWVALGGGGYNVEHVADAWTIAWAVMKGCEVPEGLHKEPELKEPSPKAMEEVERNIDFIKTNALPIVKKAGSEVL